MVETTVGNKNYSFDLPDDYGLKQSNMPTGVTVNETTQTVTIDTTQVDSIQLSEYLENNKISKEYFANSSSPQLSPPDTEHASEGPSPYKEGSIERFLVRQLYIANAKQALADAGITGDQATKILEYLVNKEGTEGTLTADEGELAQSIDKKASTMTQSQVGLPKGWTLNAKDEFWTPIPPDPYDKDTERPLINNYFDTQLDKAAEKHIAGANPALTDEQVTALKAALSKGAVELPDTLGIKDAYEAIQKMATEATQVKFGLPSSWFRGTEVEANWTPTNLNPISAAKVNILRVNMLADNVDAFIKDVEDMINKRIQEMREQGIPADDPRIVSLSTLLEFLKVTAKAMDEMKKTLAMLQAADAEMSKKKTDIKFDMLDQKNEVADEQYLNAKEQLQKQKTMEDLGTHMKWIGPTISALSTIIGVLIAVASLGTLSGLGIAMIAAGIAIGVALTAYTIADSCTGCSREMTEAFKNFLEDAVEGIEPNWVKDMCQALLAIAVLAPLIIALVAAIVTGSGAGAAASVATQAATQSAIQIGRQLIMSGMQQFLATMLLTLLMSSDALPNLLADLVTALGGDEDAVQAIRIFGMVMTAAAVVGGMALAAGAAAGRTASQVTQTASTTAKETAKTAQTTTQTATSNTDDALSRLSSGVEKYAGKVSDSTLARAESFLNRIATLENMRSFERLFRYVPSLVTMPTAITRGVVLLQLAELTEEAGDLEATQQLLKELMQLMQQVIDNLLSGVSEMGDTIADLGSATARLFNQADSSFTSAARSIVG